MPDEQNEPLWLHTIPTTCVQCGGKGTQRTSNPHIIHMTILCKPCQLSNPGPTAADIPILRNHIPPEEE